MAPRSIPGSRRPMTRIATLNSPTGKPPISASIAPINYWNCCKGPHLAENYPPESNKTKLLGQIASFNRKIPPHLHHLVAHLGMHADLPADELRLELRD